MDIRKLQVFCKVVELKSFTRTAEAVLLSQPTVSEHIRSLEQELGQKLINRLGREIEPTPVGRLLYGYGRRILRLQQEALQAVAEYSGTLAGRIMIGCGTIPGTYILPGLIGAFRTRYPSIKATLQITSSRTIAGKVMEGELELGVVGARWNERSLVWNRVFADELNLAVHPDHPWADREAIALEELVGEPFILRESASGTRRVIAQILEQHGLREAQLKEVAEIGSTAAVKEAVKAGLGVSILSRRALIDDLDCGSIATVAVRGIRLERPFYLIRRKNRELPPVAAVFLKFLLEEAEEAEETEA
ncbi:selenium metabolism-associated LysR family transcriptional regulator [Thermodesulfobacteriota bacterium B35]